MTASGRLRDELDLLDAMYPDTIRFNDGSQELTFKPEDSTSAKLVLRLPSAYPERSSPDIILATGSRKQDLRQELSNEVKTLYDEIQGEILDALIANFLELAKQSLQEADGRPDDATDSTAASTSHQTSTPQPEHKTVVIWLHHLLATSKRKLALHPSSAPAQAVSGITKPGYPGVLLFTGPASLVNDHVKELRSQNWQAFQVRLEVDEVWRLEKKGIVEVESMSEVVKMVEEGKREDFLKAVGVK